MKKILLLCFLFLWPATIDAQQQTELQQLIDNAPENSVLKLESKMYEGPVQITKPLTIIGEEGTIIQSETQGIIIKDVANVLLDGLMFETKTEPLQIDESQNVQLQNIQFTLTEKGVILNKIEHLQLHDIIVSGKLKKHFSQKPNGIEVYKTKHIDVNNVDIHNVQDGIYFEQIEDVKVNNTTADNGRYGLHFMYAKDIKLTNNTVSHNVTGLMLMIVDGLDIKKNTILRQLQINSNGLYLYDVTNANVSENEFLENTVATVWNKVRKTTFKENVFQSNSTVIESEKSPDVVVKSNQFTGNILAARSDKQAFHLTNNMYDDYAGYDFNNDLIGDTPHQTYTSFGQWMVRKPVYQYFIEAPSVVLLNKMDDETKATTTTILTDPTPVMSKTNGTFKLQIEWMSLLVAVIGMFSVFYIWRKLR